MRYLLDTNICIYILKRAPPQVFRRLESLQVGEVGLSAITYSELQFGVAKSSKPEHNQQALDGFLTPLEVLAYPAAASPVYGDLRARLQREGTPIGPLDLLIAAHALHLRVALVTNNLREFSRIKGLQLENWIGTESSE